MAKLEGMGQIEAYYKCSAPTIRALVRYRGFPAVKHGTWLSDTDEIDRWVKDQVREGIKERKRKAKAERE